MCHFWPHPLLGLQAIACQQVHVSSPKFLKSMITPVHSWTLEEVKLFHRVLCPVPNQLAAYQRIQHASPYLPTLDICYLWHLASQGGVYLTDAVQTVQRLKWYLDLQHLSPHSPEALNWFVKCQARLFIQSTKVIKNFWRTFSTHKIKVHLWKTFEEYFPKTFGVHLPKTFGEHFPKNFWGMLSLYHYSTVTFISHLAIEFSETKDKSEAWKWQDLNVGRLP